MQIKQLENFPDYEITDNGRIRSNKYKKWLTPHPSKSGHLRVWLYKNGVKIGKAVHRLVLETFVGACPTKMECRHLNGDCKDNRLKNLCWGTRSENQIDAVYHNTSASLKLSPRIVRIIVYTYKTGLFTQQQIADFYNVSARTISDIIYRRTWRHIWVK